MNDEWWLAGWLAVLWLWMALLTLANKCAPLAAACTTCLFAFVSPSGVAAWWRGGVLGKPLGAMGG